MPGLIHGQSLVRWALRVAVVAGCIIVIAEPARSQQFASPNGPEAGPATPPPAAAPQGSAAPASNPGLVEEIGKLWKRGTESLPQMPQSLSIDGLNSTAKDATDNLTRLAKPGTVITGRTICPPAPNGAPDCKLASDKLCQSKGFKEGKSLDSDTVETCSPKVWLSGQQEKVSDCRTNDYVIKALCQ